jgi:hypothetical protein
MTGKISKIISVVSVDENLNSVSLYSYQNTYCRKTSGTFRFFDRKTKRKRSVIYCKDRHDGRSAQPVIDKHPRYPTSDSLSSMWNGTRNKANSVHAHTDVKYLSGGTRRRRHFSACATNRQQLQTETLQC